MARWRLLSVGLIGLGVWAASCSPADFQSETVVDTVRILASRASEPRALPGDTVTVDLLAYNGRQPGAGNFLYWLPLLCINPPNDAYFGCFAELAKPGGDGGVRFVTGEGAGAGADAGADAEAGAGAGAGADASAGEDAGAGAMAGLRPGVDLTPLLVKGPHFTFQMPNDVIIARKGIDTSYGLVILFNFACTGHLELVPYDPNNGNPQQIPIGCFDAKHNQLGPEDFVFGFTRVYAYDAKDTDQLKERNPVISQVDLGGPRLDVDGGTTVNADGGIATFVVPPCGDPDAGGNDCDHAIGPVVGPSPPAGKQVWADFYSTVGTFSDTARLLYSPAVNLLIPTATDNKYAAPGSLTGAHSQNFIWIVVHDDQGGADWVQVPLQLGAPDGGARDGGARDGG